MPNEVLSSLNPYYQFSKISEIENVRKYDDKVTTLFVIDGKIEIEFENEKVEIQTNQGVLISPHTKILSINLYDKAVLYEVISEKKKDKLIEFVDHKNVIQEKELIGYKILENHKKVSKPWGYELWIVWLKDYHVLKKIFLKKNCKTSLQFHKEKFETNYIYKGKAKIVNNFHLEKNNHQTENKINYNNLLEKYSSDIIAPYSFTVKPHEVHRIISIEDCTSYEVSTPQLDDVIRLQDDADRKSGRILSEHN